MTDMGRSISPLPPLRTHEQEVQFTKLKRYSIALEFFEGKPSVVGLEVTDDVRGQVKVKWFHDFAYLGLSHTRAVANGNNEKKSTWIVAGTLLSSILSFR